MYEGLSYLQIHKFYIIDGKGKHDPVFKIQRKTSYPSTPPKKPLIGRRGKHQTLEPRPGLVQTGYLELAPVDW